MSRTNLLLNRHLIHSTFAPTAAVASTSTIRSASASSSSYCSSPLKDFSFNGRRNSTWSSSSCCSGGPVGTNHAIASAIAPLTASSMRHCATGPTANFQMPKFDGTTHTPYPIVQLPAESLWCQQAPVVLSDVKKSTEFRRMLERLHASRKHYQYPSMSAPQIGWNVSVFVLYDGSTWINPKIERIYRDATCFTWEPCASCAFLMHYVERPHEIVMSYYDEAGAYHENVRLDGMKSRLCQHEMDHLTGVLFTRRIPNPLHVIPMDGFVSMSDWTDDYPSIEARSTNLYTLFFPPLKFVPHALTDCDFMKRHYDDKIFPGAEMVAALEAQEENHGNELHEFIEEQKKAGLWEGSQFSYKRRQRRNKMAVPSAPTEE